MPEVFKNNIDPAKNKKNKNLFIIIAFAVPVILYLQTLSFGFTCFDDNEIIINNSEFFSDFKNILKVFRMDAFVEETGFFYRPLQTLSYMVDMHLSGKNSAWMYHFSNTILLGLIAVSLYLLLIRFLIPPKLALSSALIYCAHPLFVSSVAWIPARGDLLLSLFSLLSFLFFIKYLQENKFKYLFIHWIGFFIALFCKETAVILPLLFIIYYFSFSSRKRFEKKYLWIISLYLITVISWFLIRSEAIGSFLNQNDELVINNQENKVGIKSFQSNLPTLPESLATFFIPFDIDPLPSFSLYKTLIGLIIIALIIAVFFLNNERPKKEKIFCLSWFLLFSIPTMIFKNAAIDYLNHRFFLPLMGILLFVLFILPKKWFENGDIKRPWVLVALLLFLCFFTFSYSRSYADPITFYNSAISKNPGCIVAYNNRGAVYHNKGLLDKAIEDYTKAIELEPDYATAFKGRGNAYFKKRMYDKAVADYSKVIDLKAGDADTFNNRGASYANQGIFDKACPDFKIADKLGSRAAKVNLTRFCKE
jgi:tetratricopeptide (TPR) repeat protein